MFEEKSPDIRPEEETTEAALDLEAAVEFAENPEPRCPCVLLLDTSGSMQGASIQALNEGLKTFEEELKKDTLARKRVEVGIVTFGHAVDILQDFVTADQFSAPTLTAPGSATCMGAAILKALDLVDGRKTQYKANGVTYYRPWIFMITDGAPTDPVDQAVQRVQADESAKKVAFFAVGVAGADLATLAKIAAPTRPPVMLAGLNFATLFVWLSASMSRVSQSKPEETVNLPAPGWMAV